jgi:predicted MPP superfamily phosphohydrolase
VRQTATMPGLPAPIRIVHLTDIHASRAVPLEFVRKVVDRINADPPDLAVLTGDYVTEDRSWVEGIGRELGRIRSKSGTYAILGNHDYWTDGPGVSKALEKHGVHHLRNESVKAAGLRLIGVDDHWTRNDDVNRAMAGVGDDEPKLMLLHSPDLVHQAADAGVHLALAGHTHGGQVRLPFYGALIVPSAFGFEQGWYRSGDTRLYVNRGLGTLEMKVRVHCRPEVHELTLLPA